MLRSFLTASLIFISAFACADSKIKTRTSVMGQTQESTVYIKGARERTEGATMGPGSSMVTIMQCDQKRIITLNPQTNACLVTSLADDSGEKPAAPASDSAGGSAKGGTVTFNIDAIDTGERQKMFGFNARHIKSTMNAESSPDACSKTKLHTETDGWYADISPALSCSFGTAAPAAQLRGKSGCQDKVRFKRGGSGKLGYPLKQTVSMEVEGHNFSTTTEVVELSAATLDASLFEMPAGCKQVSSYLELMGTPTTIGTMTPVIRGGRPIAVPPPETQPEPPQPPPPAPPAPPEPVANPAAAAAPLVAPKGEGVLRVGVVKINDAGGAQLPTENLRLNLMGEITKKQFEAVPLESDDIKAIAAEAADKQCDYILYTDARQVKEPDSGGVTLPASLRGVSLEKGKYQALVEVSLYRTGRIAPLLKQAPVAADADQFGVNAVMAAFEKEADKVAEQVKKDREPSRPSKTAPARKPAIKKPS